MKKIFLTIIISIGLSIFLTGCWPIIWLVGEFQETPSRSLMHKNELNKLMNHSDKKLLSEDEKIRAAKNICELKHLDEYKNRGNHKEKALEFCKIKQDSQIYFLKEITREYFIETIYLQVINNQPLRYIKIERKYSKELRKSIPIIERLH